MKRSRLIVMVAGFAVVAMAGLALTTPDILADRGRPVDRLAPEQRSAVESLRHLSEGFSAIAGLVTPSIVTITTEGEARPAGNPMSQFFNDPRFQEFFGDMFPNPPRTYRGLGSGIVVREDGYILTNNHVVRGASELTVILSDETRLPAEVVGVDTRTDLAVLKIDTDGLPAVTFGNSDDLRIGQWVLAVGSPFSENLRTTVTTGIVSATGRSGVGLNVYEDYIQTDAAINPGNSGGALVNLDGEVVGVNTGIASRGGGSNGIGFSIPSNMARDVMDDLITTGKVTRGWLGVSIGNLDEDLAAALGVDNTDGVLVRSVVPDSPASSAGLEEGDVIVRLDGKAMRGTSELMLDVARSDPGTVVELDVVREGEHKRVLVELEQYPEDVAAAAESPGGTHIEALGLGVEPVSPQLERRFDLAVGTGMVVTSVEQGSPAAEKGLRPGDVILEVNRRAVESLRDYREAVRETPDGTPVLLHIQRGEATLFVAVRPE